MYLMRVSSQLWAPAACSTPHLLLSEFPLAAEVLPIDVCNMDAPYTFFPSNLTASSVCPLYLLLVSWAPYSSPSLST